MAEKQAPKPSINAADVKHAEKLNGLSYTDPERKQLLEDVNNRLKLYETLRAVSIENSIAPALYFDPRPASLRAPKDESKTPRTYRLSKLPKITRPKNLEDVAFWPLTHLAELVRTQKVTSLELTEMYLVRLKKYDPHLHCVVTLTEDLARKQAKRADKEIKAGKYRGPLHGIPWGAKDLFAVRGYPTTWGAEPYRDQVIDVDAAVVERLEEAGAVLVAKLTLGAIAYGDVCFDTMTRNPWNLEEGSSGSSAGSASAAAAGLVGFTMGTETLGSIVSPSTRCGTTGLRPTFGRVSRYGAMALSWSMDKTGPICRTVEDCALVFSAVYGPDGRDAVVADMPFEWNPDLKVKDLRIGYVKKAFAEKHDNAANEKKVLDVLRGLGVKLIPIELPDDDLAPLFMILLAEGAAAFDELTRNNLDDMLTWQDKEAWPNGFRAARFITAVEYIQANRIRAMVMQKMADAMQKIDVFVAPPFAGNTLVLTNLTGHPSVVLPNGFTDKGSPTSITFVGNLYREDQVLAVAKAYQDATDFHTQHPPMDYEAKAKKPKAKTAKKK